MIEPELLRFLSDLGTATAYAFWLPVLMWTAVALPAWALLSRSSLHPLAQYRLRQVLLAALPVGLVATALVDASGWLAALGSALWPAPSGSVSAGSAVMALDGAATTSAPAASSIWSWSQAVGAATVVAVGGTLVGIGQLVRDVVAFVRLRHSVETSVAPDLQVKVNALRRRLRLRRSIRVEVTERDVVPMTLTGWPVTLLLPSRLTERPEALRMTLLHECIHVRRRDDLAHVAERLVAAVFAAIPVVGWLQQSIMHYREQACDAAVLDDHETRASSYAELLVAFADRAASSRTAMLSLSESPSSLKQRLHAMKRHVAFSSVRWISGFALAALVAVTLGIVACSDSLTPPPSNSDTETQSPKPLQELTVGDDPLYIVDGEERESVDGIEPDDIASIEVLKDEAATEKYGERGANGVVIINLKQDATGDTSDAEPQGDEVFVVVEDQPDCGGVRELQQHVQYPEFAKKAGIEGRVFVQFVVDENGNIVDPKVTRGVHRLLNEAALNAVQQMECEPGTQRGEAVKVRMSLPVTFRLNDDTKTSDASGSAPSTNPSDEGTRASILVHVQADGTVRVDGTTTSLSNLQAAILERIEGQDGRPIVTVRVNEDAPPNIVDRVQREVRDAGSRHISYESSSLRPSEDANRISKVGDLMFRLAKTSDGVVSGRVTQKDTQEPVAGVSIVAESANVGAATGPDGRFQIRTPSGVTPESITVSVPDSDVHTVHVPDPS